MEELREIVQVFWGTILELLPETARDAGRAANLWQLLSGGALCVGALLLGRRLHTPIVRWCETRPRWEKARRVLEPLVWPMIWLLLLSLLLGLQMALGTSTWLLELFVRGVMAWIVVRTVSRVIRNTMLSRLTAVVAFGMVVLSTRGWLGPMIDTLRGPSFTLTLGDISINLFQVLAIALLLTLLLSLAAFVARVVEHQMRDADWVTPAGRVLLNKTLRTGLYVLAILITIGTVGIDLTALAVIGGAVGFGIGFGLQKIVSNLISGVILLMDKSIKPGDVITVENTYGWVNKLGARYVSIITRDGIEHLIPNETMITEPVSNWTHSDANTRLRIPIGVHYDTDLALAVRLGMEAARSQSRVLNDPAPRCLVKGFGESAIDLEIRFWIQDADSGVSNIKSAVILEVWRLFQENEIHIPYPQRDLHIVSGEIS